MLVTIFIYYEGPCVFLIAPRLSASAASQHANGRRRPGPTLRRQPRGIRLAGEFHREPDGSNIQGRTIDELTNGATADVWKACDRYNFFELRPTICGYDLDHLDKPFVRHADLALPVRDTDSAILIYGYSWLL